ncbi:uncharacterized protein LOC132630941 [Lycium barbarum]|uniref:uncharacterized protein LOC132630941 n=1 Tax=Lycium barbarum TaxID=112863 RepID=UPI00293F301C|nr:uncharacterized protein LOC132630941 [Lycium barbarum]
MLSRTKKEYLECEFNNVTSELEVEVKIEALVIPMRDNFKYLGSIIKGYGKIDADVAHRIKVGLAKWRLASKVLCHKKVLQRLKGKFYGVVVRPTVLYWAERWPVRNAHIEKMNVEEMRMLR